MWTTLLSPVEVGVVQAPLEMVRVVALVDLELVQDFQ
jgi:hypothetical protein